MAPSVVDEEGEEEEQGGGQEEVVMKEGMLALSGSHHSNAGSCWRQQGPQGRARQGGEEGQHRNSWTDLSQKSARQVVLRRGSGLLWSSTAKVNSGLLVPTWGFNHLSLLNQVWRM